jgi:hypothetical protein
MVVAHQAWATVGYGSDDAFPNLAVEERAGNGPSTSSGASADRRKPRTASDHLQPMLINFGRIVLTSAG